MPQDTPPLQRKQEVSHATHSPAPTFATCLAAAGTSAFAQTPAFSRAEVATAPCFRSKPSWSGLPPPATGTVTACQTSPWFSTKSTAPRTGPWKSASWCWWTPGRPVHAPVRLCQLLPCPEVLQPGGQGRIAVCHGGRQGGRRRPGQQPPCNSAFNPRRGDFELIGKETVWTSGKDWRPQQRQLPERQVHHFGTGQRPAQGQPGKRFVVPALAVLDGGFDCGVYDEDGTP